MAEEDQTCPSYTTIVTTGVADPTIVYQDNPLALDYCPEHHHVIAESTQLRPDGVNNIDWDTNITPSLQYHSNSHELRSVSLPSLQSLVSYILDLGCSENDAHAEANTWEGACTGISIEESYQRALPHFPSPSITFSTPTLEFDFRIAVGLDPEPLVVENCPKEITTVSNGAWSGSFGNGRVMAGGYDLAQAQGVQPVRIIGCAFVLQSTDEPPVILNMRAKGSLSGPSNVLDTVLNARHLQDVDAREYAFRMFATLKTPDTRFSEIVNPGLWVASGAWHGEGLIIDAYRVA